MVKYGIVISKRQTIRNHFENEKTHVQLSVIVTSVLATRLNIEKTGALSNRSSRLRGDFCMLAGGFRFFSSSMPSL